LALDKKEQNGGIVLFVIESKKLIVFFGKNETFLSLPYTPYCDENFCFTFM
jgi:hypothetical protein